RPLHVHMVVEMPPISRASFAGRIACRERYRQNKLPAPKAQGEQVMRQVLRLAVFAAVFGIVSHSALAQEKLKIGLMVTLSGPAASLGVQVRDGFNLAIKDLGGKMAGRDVEVVTVDDELKPDAAVTKVKGLLERDKVDFVIGPIFSNILQAIHRPVTESKTFLISPNAGPSTFAGKDC